MKNRLLSPLGSYPDQDEFQIGGILVWVKYTSNKNRVICLQKAEEILPVLESDIAKVEELATTSAGSTIPATVIGITIETNGSAAYECTFFDGEHEDEYISIVRDSIGNLVVRT